MANSFYIDKQNLSFTLRNGLTDILMNTLVSAGSIMARNDEEKTIIAFLSEQDQEVYGKGAVGFNIGNIPFNKDTFLREKDFILKVCDSAVEGLGRDSLSYEPDEKLTVFVLLEFKNLVSHLNFDDIKFDEIDTWYKISDNKYINEKNFEYCEEHKVIKTRFGCMLCNEENGYY